MNSGTGHNEEKLEYWSYSAHFLHVDKCVNGYNSMSRRAQNSFMPSLTLALALVASYVVVVVVVIVI